jgi:ABC-type dipeptide/oligopeptide/nickel transport system ATPase component
MGITKQGGQNMASLLEYKNVEISFGGTPVVRDFNVSLQPGEILGLVGESGSGKSTIIKAAMGLLGNNGLVTKGDIFFEGKNIPDLSEKELRTIRGAKIGMIFQDAGASLCPIRTIGEQIYESMSAHGQISKAEAKEKALDLFDKLHFKNPARIWDSYPFEMSGGMNQRAGIAIAMLMNPSILLADEPTSALDVSVQKQVVMEMLQLREMFGMAIILVTHDIGVVSAMADRILVLKDGNTMEYGNAADILNHPQNDYTKKLLSAVPRLRRC